ncbi:MAG TPA: methyl-accepting chemotaxis protein [Geobacteraceae bacterium]
MFSLNALKIRTKLGLIGVLAIVALATSMAASIFQLDSMLTSEKELKTRHLVETAYGVLEHFYGLAKTGVMPENDAKAAALGVIKSLRYEKDDYFWINDMHPVMIMHPYRPELDGKDLSEFKDADGRKLFVDVVETVRNKGAGYVYYSWEKQGFKVPVRKLSYVKGFAPWGWVIGSGIYLDDVATVFHAGVRNDLIILTLTALLFGAIIWLIALSVIAPMGAEPAHVAGIIREVADGNLAVHIESGEKHAHTLLGVAKGMVESLNRMVGKVGRSAGELSRVTGNLSDATNRVQDAAQVQSTGISGTSSAISEISASLKEVTLWVDNLANSADESSSSILEMSAANDEVAQNMGTLSDSVEEVSASIFQMSASIHQVSNGVSTLLDATTTTAISVSEMDDSIRQVETHASDTAAITDAVRQDAERGKEAVEATIAGIDEIRRSAQITSEVIATLSERVRDIGAIITVIDEVAEQTNLLALNAAIIAAQAGEHGKGFAVVADEIKQLAERTRSSTREIGQVIKGVQEGTRRAVETINKAEKSIAHGEELSADAGAALNKIVEEAQKASDQMAEIAGATVEQATGSQNIRDAMVQVADLVEQFVMASQEQAEASEMIAAAVERMKGLSAQVRNSTVEQSKVGALVTRSMANITGMIQEIRRACNEQSLGSELIVAAIEDIQHSNQLNLDTVALLTEAANSLARQVELLQVEMQAFRV